MIIPRMDTNMSIASLLFVTLGCAKNEVDTDKMRARLLREGFEECFDPQDADACIVNTCAFLTSATSESIETILELAELKNERSGTQPIIVCGCVPSRYGNDLMTELPEVAAFVPVEDEQHIVEIVRDALGMGERIRSMSSDIMRTIEGASAYVKISDGCDRFCTFCAIPYIRGRYASRPAGELIEEVRALMSGGVREIVLIGQDTGVWGSDLGDDSNLAGLLRSVAEVVRPYGGWIRVLYLQPEGMTDELIRVMRDIPEVLPYIDIPIQHCCPSILHRMGREGSRETLAALFDHLREEIPGMVLRTTGLVGFPGETEAEFEELLDFVAEQEFDYVSVFGYSREEGTRAAEFADQLDESTILDRTQRLLDVTEQMGFAATASHVGETVEVIIDGIEESESGMELIGHAWFQAPDCDGAVHIEAGEASVGDIVTCKLVDSFCYELVGEPVDAYKGEGTLS